MLFDTVCVGLYPYHYHYQYRFHELSLSALPLFVVLLLSFTIVYYCYCYYCRYHYYYYCCCYYCIFLFITIVIITVIITTIMREHLHALFRALYLATLCEKRWVEPVSSVPGSRHSYFSPLHLVLLGGWLGSLRFGSQSWRAHDIKRAKQGAAKLLCMLLFTIKMLVDR